MPGSYECVVSQSNGCEAVYDYNVGTARPIKPEICIVTVDSTTNTNLVVWEKSTFNPFNIEYYNIYRETSTAHEYKLIDTVHYSSISVFNDVVASPANRSWRYRISAVSSCGKESALSRSHKTIHLVTHESNGEVNIIWDNYEGFPYNSYDLLRKTNTDEWAVIEPDIAFASLPFHSDTPPSFDGLDYMIEVIPPGGDCSATEGKAQDYNAARSNKPTSEFNPGEGTGDPNNSLAKEENKNFTVALYPNPSNGLFEVALNHNISGTNLKMEVVDLNGKMIYQDEIQNGVNYINLQNIESGIYFVKLFDTSESETFRIIKR
jgi:fibronectin type 3 domain-containing protein